MSVEPLTALGLIALAYLCGSVPFGWIIAKAKGVNIFEHGSGNVGATNVGRVLGKKWGLFCFGLDVAKGLAPTLFAGCVLGALGQFTPSAPDAWVWLGAMAATIVGHVASPWLGFRGGKGVATGLGAFLGVFPILTLPAGLAFAAWLATLAFTRYVSVASCVAALTLPGSLFFLSLSPTGYMLFASMPFLVVSSAIALLVVWKHRGNLARLRRGEEPQIKSK